METLVGGTEEWKLIYFITFSRPGLILLQKVGVLPIRIVWSNVSSIGPSSEIICLYNLCNVHKILITSCNNATEDVQKMCIIRTQRESREAKVCLEKM